VQGRKKFQFSMSEAQRMRRGAFLVPVLVLPFAAIFALDSSKSQPTHFLLVMSIAIVLCIVVVAISLAGARAQIRHAASATLAIESDRLVWVSDSATVEIRIDEIEAIKAFRRRGNVYRVVLTLSNGSEQKIEGLDDMQDFHDTIILCKS
jgi:uncharacterized membrane protein